MTQDAGNSAAAPMAAPPRRQRRPPVPLSHHDILRAVEPFARAGHQVDLARCDRAERTIAFRPVLLPADGARPALKASLRLELPERRAARLSRQLEDGGARSALAIAEGADPERLLAALEALPPARQVIIRDGLVLTRSYRFPAAAPAGSAPLLTACEAQVDGAFAVRITAEESEVVHPVELCFPAQPEMRLPRDFFAVLGRRWRPLERVEPGRWRAAVRVPAGASRQGPALERALDQAVVHCRASFGADPAAFHPRHARARWRFAFQRSLPLLLTVAAVATFFTLIALLPKTPAIHALMTHVPLIMIVAVSLLKESPRLELPRIPRPLSSAAWAPRATPPPGTGVAGR